MWELKFVYFHPVVEFEDECILNFDDIQTCYRVYDFLQKSSNVLAVFKPLQKY